MASFTPTFEIDECIACGGPGLLQSEGGWCVYVECLDCGSHTAFFEYKGEEDRIEAERKAVELWNRGKVIREARLE